MSRIEIGPHKFDLNQEEVEQYRSDERYYVYTDEIGTHAVRFRRYSEDDMKQMSRDDAIRLHVEDELAWRLHNISQRGE